MSANYTQQKPTYLINQKPKRAKPVNEQQKKSWTKRQPDKAAEWSIKYTDLVKNS